MITLSDVINRKSSFDFDRFSKDIANLSKGECEELLGNIQSEILKGGDSDVLHSCRSLVLDMIEKAKSGVYADTPENRKLGRVGQQYGSKKQDDQPAKVEIYHGQYFYNMGVDKNNRIVLKKMPKSAIKKYKENEEKRNENRLNTSISQAIDNWKKTTKPAEKEKAWKHLIERINAKRAFGYTLNKEEDYYWGLEQSGKTIRNKEMQSGKGKTTQERQAAFIQKHEAIVEKWKKEGNIAGLKKEIAAIKMKYGNDRKTAEKKIKPLEDAITAAKSNKSKKDNSITDKTLHNTLRELALTGTLRNLKGVSPKRRGEIMDELEKRGYLEPNSINVTKKGTAWLSGLL